MMVETAAYLWLSLVAVNETYQYRVEAFHESNFASEAEFEAWLDGLGAEGYQVSLLWPNNVFDPTDDERFFIRSQGGPTRLVDYGIERYGLPVTAGVERWVAEYDRLGREGKSVVHLYSDGGESRVVTAVSFVDGARQIRRWKTESAGSPLGAGISDFKRAAKRLAKSGYVPLIGAPTSNFSELLVVGIGDQTEGRQVKVKARFKSQKSPLTHARLEGLANRQGKKGFRLASLFFVGSPPKILLVFAKEVVNGRRTRRECLVESYSTNESAEAILNLLNDRGAQGFEFSGTYPLEDDLSPHFLLCDPS